MRTIHKHTVYPGVVIRMAHNAFPVLFDEQRGTAMLWIETDDDPDYGQTKRQYTVIGTGHEVPRNSTHIASYITKDDKFVWHLYEMHGEVV